MIYSTVINRVLKFIYKAHEGAVDQGGIPYVFHPLAVAEQMDDENSTLLALLHDVVEDTEYTFEDIKELGVPDDVSNALKLMTRDKTEFYFDYLDKIKTNPLATKAKLADLKHNSDLTRTDTITEYDLKRLKKYNKAREVLTSKEPIAFFDDVDVPDNKLSFAVIIAKYDGKFVLCKHKNRQTWECPGGRREQGEIILETAKRELYEETGATDFTMKEVCTYKVLSDNTYGVLYFADIKEFKILSNDYEMAEIGMFDELPNKLTYPLILPKLIERLEGNN